MKKSKNNVSSPLKSTVILLVIPTVLSFIIAPTNNPTSIFYMTIWSISQWLPINANLAWNNNDNNNDNNKSHYGDYFFSTCWNRMHHIFMEQLRTKDGGNDLKKVVEPNNNTTSSSSSIMLDIPIVDIQTHRHHLSSYLQQTYGKHWRKRPLLLKGLWTQEELNPQQEGTRRRHLSIQNLLNEQSLQIPYFTNASNRMLSPDGYGSVGDILHNITQWNKPHKIGTQFIIEKYPQWISDVAPLDIVTELFGNYFSPRQIRGAKSYDDGGNTTSGLWNWFPAATTVPVFIANGNINNNINNNNNDKNRPNKNEKKPHPYTALHCEPIGNIAVQLSGQKKWTLIQPEYSFHIKPSIAPDGRAFFASWLSTTDTNDSVDDDYERIPKYTVITTAGDAIWVPTWTWHRVDYIETETTTTTTTSSSSSSNGKNGTNDDNVDNDMIAFGASLFHFRLIDFIQNNVIFAGLIVPAMLKELLGFNTQ